MQNIDPIEIKQTVKAYVLDNFLPGEDPDEMTDTTSLVTGGILDSLATVKLVNFLEKRYNIEFRPHEMSAEYLDNLNIIAETLSSKRPA